MASRQDILFINGSPVIQDNDFLFGDSDEQHIEDTIVSWPGWWKENPADGVGIIRYLNGSGIEQSLAREIKIQLQSDGYIVDNPEVIFQDGKKLIINPNATII